MSGSVAAWAARETPRFSVSHAGDRPRVRRSRPAPIGVAQAMRPAVASADNWSPASRTRPGSMNSRTATVQPSAVAACPARPLSRASSTTPAISPARTTDADAPAKATYATIARTVTTDRRRRPRRPAHAPTAAATIAMFQPEMATTWLTPAVVNAAARSRSTRSRNPIRIPAASPASGSGRTRRERIAGPASPAFEDPACIGRAAFPGSLDGQRVRAERAIRLDPPQVRAIGRVRRRAHGTFDRDRVARDDRRVAGQGGRDADRGTEPGALTSVARCWPSRGDPTASTCMIHGPRSSGSINEPAVAPGPPMRPGSRSPGTRR